ncbi:MAG TPA: hypothetical protein VMZ11_04375 [Mycobacteriales bacterium]|nr:hypothetical protein [Mycobacteriales bacterium]
MAEPIKPARGVDLAQVLPVTGVLTALGAALITACVLYRRGRLPRVEQALAGFEQRSGMPAWTTVPSAVSALSLITAGFGFYWDVAVHIDNGRDQNPFGTPAHWPIVLGLCGLVAAGILAITLDRDTDGGAALQLPFGLRCSLGAGLITLCGFISLMGFPLDDIWHNVFGQDVTLWSPTHIQMIGGASLTTLATWVLLEEGRRRTSRQGPEVRRGWRLLEAWRSASIAGSFLIGLSTLQDEFDMGVPQFNPLYHPILIALAAGIALTAARVRIGRGAALQAVLFFLAVRGIWALLIGGVFELTTPHMPLYLVEALLVEGVAATLGTQRALRFALVSGGLIGTVGVASEWAFSQVAFALPWESVLFPEAYLLALVAGVAGAVLGTASGGALRPEPASRPRSSRLAVGVAFAAVLAVIGVALPVGSHDGYSADVTVTAAGPHEANLVVRLDPPTAARDAAWFNVTSWQGGDLVSGNGLRLTLLDEASPGVYRTHGPVPVDGDYKTVLRLATSTTQQAVPIYLPEDKGIPAAGVAAAPHFVRTFVPDVKILQREQVGGSAQLKHAAYGILAVLALLWIATLAFGLQRLDRAAVRPLKPLRLQLHRRTAEGSFA